eukprot:9457209-Prorocentrum_lima.AAC.1
MTSSLVGSEMCIRDRCYNRDMVADPLTKGKTLGNVLNTVLHNGEWVVAVSYTHLTLPTICSV